MLDDKVGEIVGDIFGEYRRREAKTPVTEIKLLTPCAQSKIICVGRNYVEHAKELGNEVPKVPLIFLKPPSSIISNGEHIILPPQSHQVEHEAELVIVINKRGRNVTPEQAKDYIFGYTIGDDITARDLQQTDGQWTRAKCFDTFCSFGPWIDTEFDSSDAVVTCRVNGQMRQMASTRDMVFNVSTLIAYISSVMTLSLSIDLNRNNNTNLRKQYATDGTLLRMSFRYAAGWPSQFIPKFDGNERVPSNASLRYPAPRPVGLRQRRAGSGYFVTQEGRWCVRTHLQDKHPPRQPIFL